MDCVRSWEFFPVHPAETEFGHDWRQGWAGGLFTELGNSDTYSSLLVPLVLLWSVYSCSPPPLANLKQRWPRADTFHSRNLPHMFLKWPEMQLEIAISKAKLNIS